MDKSRWWCKRGHCTVDSGKQTSLINLWHQYGRHNIRIFFGRQEHSLVVSITSFYDSGTRSVRIKDVRQFTVIDCGRLWSAFRVFHKGPASNEVSHYTGRGQSLDERSNRFTLPCLVRKCFVQVCSSCLFIRAGHGFMMQSSRKDGKRTLPLSDKWRSKATWTILARPRRRVPEGSIDVMLIAQSRLEQLLVWWQTRKHTLKGECRTTDKYLVIETKRVWSKSLHCFQWWA